MECADFNKRLLAIGEKVKAKGWQAASIDIGISYLAIFDRPPGPLDPMIHFHPNIRSSTRDKHGIPTSHHFGGGFSDIKTLDEALASLEKTADDMPTMAEQADRLAAAKAKLSDEERQLLGAAR